MTSPSRRARKWLIVVATVLAIAIAFVVTITISGMDEMRWNDYTPSNSKTLADFVDYYKDESGKYPNSLDELFSYEALSSNAELTAILSAQSKTRYSVHSSSNGFSIVAVKDGTWFSKSMTMSNFYSAGGTNH